MISAYQEVVDRCIVKAALIHGIDPKALLGKSKQYPRARARMLACWLIKKSLGVKWASVAAAVNRIDHTTAMHAIKTIDAQREQDQAFRDLTDRLLAEVTTARRPGAMA